MKYFCRECGALFPSELNVIKHAFSQHSNLVLFCSPAVNLVRRVRPTPMEFMDIQGGFFCCVCTDGIIFQTTLDLRRHHEGQHYDTFRPPQYMCSVCDLKSGSESLMTEHMQDHFMGRRYRCVECSTAFCNKNEIMQHLQDVHRVQMLYSCNGCGEPFPSELNVIKHASSEHSNMLRFCFPAVNPMSIVRRRRPARTEFVEIQGGFLCCVCADGIIFQSTLDLRRHHQEQHNMPHPLPFLCSICTFKSEEDWLMMAHLQDHFDGRRYLCLECSTAFREKCDIERHLKEVHRVQMLYSCTQCEDSYPSELNVIKHVLSKHNNMLRFCGPAVNLVRRPVGQTTATNATEHAESSHSNFEKAQGPAVNPGQQDVRKTTSLLLTRGVKYIEQPEAGRTVSGMEATGDSEDAPDEEYCHLVHGMMYGVDELKR